MPPDQARQAALRSFGNRTLLKEEARAVWTWLWLEQLRQDLRYARACCAAIPALLPPRS